MTKPKKSVVDTVVESVIQDLIDGRLSPGDQIPTETELAQKLHAGRNSVREAIKKLEAYGVVEIRRADGTYVREQYSQKMLDPILYHIILQKNCWNDFVEMRKVIDTGTLHVVVGQPGLPANLPEMEAAIAAMKQALARNHPDPDEIMGWDTRFHNLITQATGNPQLASINEYVTRLTVPSRLKTIERVLESGDRENFVALHSQQLEIIREKRPERIDQAVIDHYMYWK